MINLIGNYLIILSCTAGVIILFQQLFLANRSLSKFFSFTIFAIQNLSILLAMNLLIIATTHDDFTNPVAFFSSELKLPLFYKIAASWSNHSGSLLFWLSLMSLIFVVYLNFSQISPSLKKLFLERSSNILLFFAIFIAVASNPFTGGPVEALDGQGLNPILQDVALAIHPPILFLSYSILALLFCQTLISFQAPDSKELKKEISYSISWAFSFSTMAIGLGSWWAYRELGWGGYWFWDPVENLSLLPWLTLLALVHSNGSIVRESFFPVTCTLSILAFLSSITSSLLIRLGILTSVHSFAVDGEKAIYILGFLLIFLIYSFIFIIRTPKSFWISPSLSNFNFLLISQLIIIMSFFSIIIIGTIAPLIYQILLKETISTGAEYYQTLLKILLVPLLIIMSLISCFKKDFDKARFIKLSIFFMVFILLSKIIYKILSPINLTGLLILVLSLVTICSLIFVLGKKKRMFIGHLGFLLILGTVTIQNSLQLEEEIMLKDTSFSIFNNKFQIKYELINSVSKETYNAFKLKALLTRGNKEVGYIEPEVRLYPKHKAKISEVHILKDYLFNDIYTTIELDIDGNILLRVRYKILMSIIWLGVLMMICSTLKIKRFYA